MFNKGQSAIAAMELSIKHDFFFICINLYILRFQEAFIFESKKYIAEWINQKDYLIV